MGMCNSFNLSTLFILQRLLIAQAENWLLFCHLMSEIVSTRICSALSSIIFICKKTPTPPKNKTENKPTPNPNKALFVHILGSQCDHFRKDTRKKKSCSLREKRES